MRPSARLTSLLLVVALAACTVEPDGAAEARLYLQQVGPLAASIEIQGAEFERAMSEDEPSVDAAQKLLGSLESSIAQLNAMEAPKDETVLKAHKQLIHSQELLKEAVTEVIRALKDPTLADEAFQAKVDKLVNDATAESNGALDTLASALPEDERRQLLKE